MISATPGCSVPDSRMRAAATATIRSWLAALSSLDCLIATWMIAIIHLC